MAEFSLNYLQPYGFKTGKELTEGIRLEGYAIARTLWFKSYHHIELDKVPRWAWNTKNKFTIAMEEDTSKMYEAYVHETFDRVEAKRLPSKPAVDVLIPKTSWDKLFSRRETLLKLSVDYDKARWELQQEVKPVLDSFNTTKQLLETWPSMEKFLPANIADPDKGITLPALSLSRLEAKINGNTAN